MADNEKLGLFEKIMITIILLILLATGIFLIYDRINRGCWDTSWNDFDEELVFEMNNYSCEELKSMLLVEVFPKEARKITISKHCDGEVIKWGSGEKIATEFFYEYDYKNKYREVCLEPSSYTTKEKSK